MSDRIFGLLGLALALFYAASAYTIKDSFLTDVVGPRAFPYIIATMLGLASLAILLRPDPEPHWPGLARLGEIAAAIVVMIVYAQLLPILGFLIASALATAYLTWRLGTRALMSFVVGALTSCGIYIVFKTILGLSLARGPLGF